MKKLLAIICVLLVIFIGMYIYKNSLKQNNVKVSEVQEIEEYISKIYMWQEITEEALPKFDNINNAPDLWVWEVVKRELENYELSYYEIQEKAIEIFGDNLKKEFPKEGTQYLYYDENIDKYIATGMGLDMLEDRFFINNIKRVKNGYEVEIVEFLEDYQDSMKIEEENEVYNIYIRDLNQKMSITIKSTDSETRAIEVVKENIDNFNKKIINLIRNSEGKICIESVK